MAARVIGIKYSQSAFNIIHVAWHVHKTRDATYRLPAVTDAVDDVSRYSNTCPTSDGTRHTHEMYRSRRRR